jgi:hypothetical protein
MFRHGPYSDWLCAGQSRDWGLSPVNVKNIHVSISSMPALGPTQLPVHWVPGAGSPRLRRPRREADLSPPTSAVVKRTQICASTPPYIFTA